MQEALDEASQDLIGSPPTTTEEWIRHIRNGLMPTIKNIFSRLDGDIQRRKLVVFYRAARIFDPLYARTISNEVAESSSTT